MAEYLVQDTTMTGIADAVRNLRHEKGTLTPAQIEAKINDSHIGVPVNVTNHIVNNKWVRPSEYPNLDSIDLTNFEGVYLTYDLRKTPGHAYIAVNAQAKVGSTQKQYYVQRGHLENSSFVVDETHTVNSTYSYRDTLDGTYGDVQLWRVIPAEGNLYGFYFVTNVDSNNCIAGGYQPVVERRGRLPYISNWGSSLTLTTNGRSYMYNSTLWLEKEYIILPSATNVACKYAYRDSFSLQELTILGENNGNITIDGSSNSVASGMFQNCYSLPYVDLSNLRLGSSQTDLNAMFSGAHSLLSIDLGDMLVTNNTYNTASLFTNALSLQKIRFGKKIKISNGSYMFNQCVSLTSFDVENLDASAVTSMYSCFSNCKSLKTLDLSSWSMPDDILTDTRSAFAQMISLTELKMPNHWGIDPTATNANGVPADSSSLVKFNGLEIYQTHTYASGTVSLSHESLVNILTKLPTITTSKTITINAANKNKLTSEEIAIATNKGWTVA